MSQLELERRAKLTRGTVNQIETEKNQNPSIAVCLAIVNALRDSGAKGVDVEVLFGSERVASS